MRRIAVAALLVTATLGLASCSETGIKAEDAYKIGCPAIDSAAAGGSVAGRATAAGLRKLSESGQLDPEPQKWVDAAIELLDSPDPKAAPWRPSSSSSMVVPRTATNCAI